jgi:amino acid transporter
MSGEMKLAGTLRRQMQFGGGGNLVAMIPLILMGFLLVRAAGYEFLSSVTYAMYSGESFPVPPYPSFFIAMMSPPAIALLFAFTSMFWTTSYNVACIAALARKFFAWSFDRIVPEKLSHVSERFHAPVYATALGLIIGEIFLYIVVYYGNLLLIYSVLCLLYLVSTTFPVALSCAIFPYRTKGLYELSSVKRHKIGGLPLATVVGILALAVNIFVAYILLGPYREVLFAGWDLATIVGSNAAVLILGLVVFYIAKTYRKRQGLSIDLAFKEIPPE